MVGLQLRGQTCGPNDNQIRSETGFDICDVPPNPVGFVAVPSVSVWLEISQELLTPVDPAGPHCYRDGTKTC